MKKKKNFSHILFQTIYYVLKQKIWLKKYPCMCGWSHSHQPKVKNCVAGFLSLSVQGHLSKRNVQL